MLSLKQHITEHKLSSELRVVLACLLAQRCRGFDSDGALGALGEPKSLNDGAIRLHDQRGPTRHPRGDERPDDRPPLRQPPCIIGREISRQPYRRAIAAQDREALQ